MFLDIIIQIYCHLVEDEWNKLAQDRKVLLSTVPINAQNVLPS
jgi:hypothetical protein